MRSGNYFAPISFLASSLIALFLAIRIGGAETDSGANDCIQMADKSQRDCISTVLRLIFREPRQVTNSCASLAHPWLVSRVVFTPDSKKLITACRDGVRIWDLSTRRVVRHFRQLTGWAQCDISSDGRYLAMSGEERSLVVWDVVQDRPLVFDFGRITDELTFLKFAPDSYNLAAGGFDGKVYVWSLSTGNLWHADTGGLPVMAVGFMPGNKLFSAEPISGAVVWHYTPPGGDLHLVSKHRRIYSADVIPGTTSLVVGEDWVGGDECQTTYYTPVSIWHTEVDIPKYENEPDAYESLSSDWVKPTHSEMLRCTSSTPILAVRCFPDGRYVAVASGEGTVRVIDVKRGYGVLRFVGHRGLILTIDISPDGKWLASGSKDKTVRIWSLSPLYGR